MVHGNSIAQSLQSVGIMHIIPSVLSPIMKEGLERNVKGCCGAAIKSIVFVMTSVRRDLGSPNPLVLLPEAGASIDYPIRIRWTAESEAKLSND